MNVLDKLLDKLFTISGFPFPNDSSNQALLARVGADKIIQDILADIRQLKLAHYKQGDRIGLIDRAVKCGNLVTVKALTEEFIRQGFINDILIPSKHNMEVPFRPVFWLASVVTRQPGVPRENYRAIENYLCERLQIPASVIIDGIDTSREKYLRQVELWKHEQNIRFFTDSFRPAKKPRFRLHELMDAIESHHPSSAGTKSVDIRPG